MSNDVSTRPADDLRGSRRRAHPLVRYVLTRLGISVLLLWGITVVTFVLTNLVPADPLAAVLGDQAAADPQIVAEYRRLMGLDDPLPLQYWHYLVRLLHGDLGTSPQTRHPVAVDLAGAFPATAELATAVLVVSVLLGVGLGLLAALRHRRFTDQVIRVVSLLGVSTPMFWLSLVVFYVFFFRLRWLPGSGRLDATLTPPPHVTGFYTIDGALAGQWSIVANASLHLVLPALVLTLYIAGLLVRFTRSAVLDVLAEPYVTAARARGLAPAQVTFGYVLRGALLPILTMVGLAFGSLLSGAVLTEQIFAWNGLGQYAYLAATKLDLPAIMGVGIVVGVTYIAINFLVDLVTGVVDPRVRLR
ncbi:ABC transporter permease [Cellulomonas citrea]|uniref:ABC transporter permease n=1 Tax=Cellulomonas citrea TaxID=1909423 RepID=UPI00135BE370|nr:ABC transporter permease [Cellulomonas citrea]